MKPYIVPMCVLLTVSPESILATADSGIKNAEANMEEGWGKLYPVL